MALAVEKFALDRASGNRWTDADGRLHIRLSNISKANICPYYGEEIPGWEELGLEATRVYQMLRDPEELARGASTFNNIQLLDEHIPVNVDDPQQDRTVGSTGTDAMFMAPYLQNSLVVWVAASIAGIETREVTELSCAYRYTPDMTPGNYEGLPYDGIMRNIIGNHVALVEAGRAGPDVVVGDKQLENSPMAKPVQSRKALMVQGALAAYVLPLLASDKKVDFGSLVQGVNRANFADKIPTIITAAEKATKGKLAADKTLDGLKVALDAMKDEESGAADEDDIEEMAGDEDETDEEKAARLKKEQAADEDDDDMTGDEEDDKVDKKAMDAAISKTRRDTLAEFNAIRAAEKAVEPFVGEVVAMDSAAAVYKFALDHLGVDVTGVHPSAYAAVLKAQPKPAADDESAPVAMDASISGKVLKRFPAAGSLKTV